MDFFTSDLHIGHDKPFIYKPRGFDNIIEHDHAILKNWNSVVKPEDTVYILGDLALGNNISEWNFIFYNLKGKKKFIYGNHDTANKIKIYTENYGMENLGFANIYKYSKKWRFLLSHYPTYCGNFDDYLMPLVNLSGHTHSKDKFFNKIDAIYNVALDAHNCFPVSIETIISDIKNKKER